MTPSLPWLSAALVAIGLGAASAAFTAGCGGSDDAAGGGPSATASAGDDGGASACDDGGGCALDGGSGATDGAPPPVPPKLVDGFFNAKDHGAKGDGVADDTKAIAATIALAGAAGGGVVLLPAGRYRITGELSVPSAVTLAGQGFTPTAGAANGAPPATLGGSWIVVDKSYLHGAAITLAQPGAVARDFAVWHEQPAPGPGWAPRAFGWAIDMPIPDTLVRHVWLENATLGVHGIGRTTIEDLHGEPITTGISIDTAYDVVRIRNVRFDWTGEGEPVWSADASVKAKLGVGIESYRNDNPEIYDVKVAGYDVGVHFGASVAGITSKFALMDTTIAGAGHGLVIDGASTTGKIARFWETDCGTGIFVTGAGSVVSGADVDLRGLQTNGVRVEAPNAFVLLNQLNVVDFDQVKKGFPGVEAADASATAKVGLFHNVTGGTVPFGGVGHVDVDANAANATFDLRVMTPTEVPEMGLVPYHATTDVRAHGAKGDGVTDDTAAIQAAMSAVAAAGGGPVVVPAGDYRLKGGLKVPAKVTLAGIGWQGQGTGAPPAKTRGSVFTIDAANGADAVELGDDAGLQSIAMRWDQGTLAAGWQPRGSFGWAVRITGVRATARDLFLLNPTKGVAVTSASAGSVLVDRVFGSPLSIGLRLDTAATVRANDLHFWPFWGLGGAEQPYVPPYVEAHAIAFESLRSAHAEISDAFSISYQYGVHLGQNAAGQVSTDLRLWNTDQDVGVRGYVISGPGSDATFANFSAQGDTNATSPGVTGIWAEASATNAHLAGYNGDLRIFTGNAVRSDAAGASVLVNLTRLEGFGRAGAFPPVEGAAAGPEEWINGS